MKLEPLKDKRVIVPFGSKFVYYEGNVKSAIDWLENEDRKVMLDLLNKKIDWKEASARLYRNIREAFKDVFK